MYETKWCLWQRVSFGLYAVLTLLVLIPLSAPAQARAPARTARSADFEMRFLQDMIDHHAMAVEMAAMCLSKATHDELRALCRSIRTTQQDEIQTMQDWLQDWYGVSHRPTSSDVDQKEMSKLERLADGPFETAFLEQMILHHARAVSMGSDCFNRADHNPLIGMCMNIIATQFCIS